MSAATVNRLAVVVQAAMRTHCTAAGIALAVDEAVVAPLRERNGELEAALGAAVGMLRSAAGRLECGLSPDTVRLRESADELEGVQYARQADADAPVPYALTERATGGESS